MFRLKTHERKAYPYVEHFKPDKMKRKMVDGRRRSRKAPALHPWRQYQMTNYTVK